MNRLDREKSPYLLQHKDNPVWWYAWGEEAFAAARREDKPIFLSIGYSTCYWCHVMERDSFELPEVAEVLNKHYISIKLDREERPDIDAIYMDAVVALTGQGGWPMSVFLTPDLKPFWGGTFFYRAQFIKILEALNKAWESDREKIFNSSEHITAHLKDRVSEISGPLPEAMALEGAFQEFEKNFDPQDAGFGTAPKFPPSQQISFLLRFATITSNQKEKDSALSMATKTLIHMARGGLYDHLGGGFHRYSTDAQWVVPHFEKMLYDNALLAFSYLEAFQVTGNSLFASVAEETLSYVLQEMAHPRGGFFSAQDAGEVNREGEFYVWSEAELRESLTENEFKLLSKYYPLSAHGNFEEGKNILTYPEPNAWEHKYSDDLKILQKKLYVTRNTRTRPHLDDKVLCAWNGLMLSAFCKGFQVLGNQRFLEAAEKCADFLRAEIFREGVLFRRWREGEARFAACLDDYTYLIEGLLHLYESNFDSCWFEWALTLQELQDRTLWDEARGAYMFTEAKEAIVRKIDLIDNATPAGNSVAALNLLRFYGFQGEEIYRQKAERIFAYAAPMLERYASGFPKLLQALHFRLGDAKEIAIVAKSGDDELASEMRKELYGPFRPHKVLAISVMSDKPPKKIPNILKGKNLIDGMTAAYVCKNQTCGLPCSDLDSFRKLL